MIDLNAAARRYPTILVIGGTGFIGAHLIARLAATRRRVIVPTRSANHARRFSVLPTVEVVEANVHDQQILAGLVGRCDAVINLVGILHSRRGAAGSRYGPAFAQAHVELPKAIASTCHAAGVERLLHMSALGASAQASSMYLRSKADGEAAVRAAMPAATMFEPSVVFGPQDHFLNLFASLQRFFPVMPLGGAQARFQPIYVGDVAQAFVNVLENPATFGKTYQLGGPTIYTLRQLVTLAGEWSGHQRPVIALPSALARLQAWMLEWVPGGPLMSRDNLDSMKQDNILSAPLDAELGIEPSALEAHAPAYLAGRF